MLVRSSLFLMLACSLALVTSACRIVGGQGNVLSGDGLVYLPDGKKDIFHIEGDQVYFWRCALAAGSDPSVTEVGVSGMNAACEEAKTLSKTVFRSAWTNAYLKGARRMLSQGERRTLSYLIEWMEQKPDTKNPKPIRTAEPGSLSAVSGFLEVLPAAFGLDPIGAARVPVAGFDLQGPTKCFELPVGSVCPMIATPESDACLAKGGRTTRCQGCNVICSEPIKVDNADMTGFDFSGPRTCAPLPATQACPMLASATTGACSAADGKISFCSDCSMVCDKPISPSNDRIDGFDFAGRRSCEPLRNGFACPNDFAPLLAACREAGGEAKYCHTCQILCDRLVETNKEIQGYTLDGEINCAPLPPNRTCRLIATPETDACQHAGGLTIRCEDCRPLCTVEMKR